MKISADSTGATIAFMLSATRNAQAAERFFRKTLHAAHATAPRVITVDKNPAYPVALATLYQAGLLPQTCVIRTCKYLKNTVEQDHRFVKRRVKLGLGFGSFPTAWHTLLAYEAINRLGKGQLTRLQRGMPSRTPGHQPALRAGGIRSARDTTPHTSFSFCSTTMSHLSRLFLWSRYGIRHVDR